MGDPVAERLRQVRERLAAACDRAGRSPSEVTLVAVSKRQPLELLRAMIDAGQQVFGESQVQEALAKGAELPSTLDWHFIGPLQSNKIKRAARFFGAVHSVDRPKIARGLDKEAAALGRVLSGFLQINLGEEASKHGFAPQGLAEAIRPLADLAHLRIDGLMAIPPYEEDQERARDWFRRLRDLREELAQRAEWERRLGALSMGMSHDFETAIEEGATHVRVGSSLFGARP